MPIEDQAAFDESMTVLSDVFGIEWLENINNNHPIQLLWSRTDWLASSELYLLGASLKVLVALDKRWAYGAIRKIKGPDANNRRGAIFEIIAAALWHNPARHRVRFPPDNNPGFDLAVQFTGGHEAAISLKTFGRSVHHYEVEREARCLEGKVRHSPQNCVFIVQREQTYPTSADWQALHAATSELLRSGPGAYRLGDWHVLIIPLRGSPDRVLHRKKRSYSLIVLIPFHKNEELNLRSKIDDAAANLVRFAAPESKEHANFAFISVSPDASLATCERWVDSYLGDNPESPLSAVFLYQPSVATNSDRSRVWISHAFVARHRSDSKWVAGRPPTFGLCFPIGGPEVRRDSVPRLLVGNGRSILIDGSYIYQAGHHYYVLRHRNDGPSVETYSRSEFGIHEHIILNVEGGESQLDRIVPEHEELVLF